MNKWKVRLEWKPPDLWVGVFWKTTHITGPGICCAQIPVSTDIWVCLIPCVPIHITVPRNTDSVPY